MSRDPEQQAVDWGLVDPDDGSINTARIAGLIFRGGFLSVILGSIAAFETTAERIGLVFDTYVDHLVTLAHVVTLIPRRVMQSAGEETIAFLDTLGAFAYPVATLIIALSLYIVYVGVRQYV